MCGKITIALALLALAANATELSLEQGILAPGRPVALGMKLAAGKDVPTGVQFDLEYDAAALDLSVEAGPAAQQASKNLRSALIQPGKLRVLIIGFNRTTISDGVLAVVHVSYKGSDTGKTFPVRLTALSGTNANAEKLAVTAKDGSVRVEK
jgi:Cohesin domain